MNRSRTRISWYDPRGRADLTLIRRMPADVGIAQPRDIRRDILIRVGVPNAVGVTSARYYAVALLELAAEVEHALLVQYLYTAQSIEVSTTPAAEDYHVKVMNIAIQEMGHLITLENLLLLVRG